MPERPERKVAGPTAMRPPDRDRRASGPPAAAPSGGGARRARVTALTAIVGVERKRIAVTGDDLRALAPGAAPVVLARALRLVQAYVVEDSRDTAVVLWGQRAQQDYAELVSDLLALSQADVLARVTAHLGRMTEILGSIDIGAVAGADGASGPLTAYLKRVSRKIDTREELGRASAELEQLVRLMRKEMDGLLDLRRRIEEASTRIDGIGDEVEAAALSAQFLSTYLRDTDEARSRRFLERSMSLTQSALQIRGSASLRESQVEQPLRLIGAIQDAALVMVPGWLGSIASLTALAGRRPTPTEAGETAFQLRKILERLER